MANKEMLFQEWAIRMSDKTVRITDRRLSVASTLREAIRTFDATSVANDLALEFWMPYYAAQALSFHNSLEKGMKYLSSDYKNTHDLAAIYRRLSKSKRKLGELLDGAFDDTASFYGIQIDRKRWNHFRDFELYLSVTGDNTSYQNLRFWDLEENSDLFEKPLPDLLINRELVRFIYDVLTGYDNDDGGPFFVSQLVEREIRNSFHRKGYEDNGNWQRSMEDPEALEEDNRMLRQWVVNEHNSLLSALEDAYRHNFDVLNHWSNTVLKDVYASLEETDDYRIKFALKYKLATFDAKSSDCDYETISLDQVRKVRQRGTRETFETLRGWPLGNITERHDGLWLAENTRGTWWDIAVDRDTAIRLLIQNGAAKDRWRRMTGRLGMRGFLS